MDEDYFNCFNQQEFHEEELIIQANENILHAHAQREIVWLRVEEAKAIHGNEHKERRVCFIVFIWLPV